MENLLSMIQMYAVGFGVRCFGLFAVASLIWFLGPMISIRGWAPLAPVFNRIIVVAVLFTGYGLYALVKWFRAREKNKKLMAQVSAGAGDSEQDDVDAARADEVEGLRERFDDAMQLLKKMQPRGKRNRLYLYELPWYVIIGGPGSGKTTFLLNSQLRFPLADELGASPVRGVGGTRDCDWFFTDDAIFLDTAGRYTTQDSHRTVDKAAWEGFLGLLTKCRPRRPINGVLVAMSMSDLMGQDEQERIKHTREIHRRIMELYDVLGNRFPIYMVFTKCDLVAGFDEFFAELSREEREQVWGETFPNDGPHQLENHLAGFERDCDEVLGHLNYWALRRIQEERDIHRRGLILSFPQQVAMLKPAVASFLQELFRPGRHEVEPFLRGVYFTSGTQEGMPIDRIMGVLADTYGIDRQELPVFSGRGKSYFITRFLKEVVFAEAELAGVAPRVERRRRLLRWGAYGALALLVAGMSGLWTMSYFKNRSAIAKVEAQVQKYRAVSVPTGNPDGLVRAVVERLNILESARGLYPPRSLTMGFGLYQGDQIRSAINDAYNARLRADLLPEVARRLEMQMNRILKSGNAADNGFLYELLRAYLMLGMPDKMDTKTTAAAVSRCWTLGFPVEPQLVKHLCVHTDNLLKILRDPMPLDKTMVDNVRVKLKAVPLADQIYNQLKSVALEDHTNDFNLLRAVPNLDAEFFTTADGRGLGSLSIPGLYTRNGYDQYFREQGQNLVKRALKENWVLNRYTNPSSNLGPLYHDLQTLYFADYAIYWQKLLSNLQLKQPEGSYGTIRLLDYLSGPDSPVSSILQAVEKNTRLTQTQGNPPGVPFSGQSSSDYSGPAARLAASFQGLNALVEGAHPRLGDYLRTLGKVKDAMMQASVGASGSSGVINPGVADSVKEADIEFADLPEPLRGWFRSAISSAWGRTLGRATTELGSLWREQVVARYQAGLQGRYPLVRGSGNDATIDDFASFFAPGGAIDSFFKTHLQSFVDTSGPRWRVMSMDNQSIHLSAGAIRELQYAAKIREAFFPMGATLPSVRFQLKPVALDRDIASMRIEIDGQTDAYTNGAPASPKTFKWPGPESGEGASITVTTVDKKVARQSEGGAWALFRLLDRATVERTGLGNVFRVTFHVRGHRAEYELRASSVYNPFDLNALREFRCPGSL